MRRRSWGWRLAAVVAAGALALGLAACGDDDDDAAADTAARGTREVTLNLGYVTTPEHPYGIALDQYVKNVSSASGGAIALTTIPTYSGGSDVQLLQDVSDGAVEMASVSAAVWPGQGVTSFQALQALGLITRYDLEGRGDRRPDRHRDAQGHRRDRGQGPRHPRGRSSACRSARRRPLTGAASWKGKSIRTPESSVLETGISALGADPNPLPLGDVYSALREGTVDGMEANLGLVVTQKFYEVAGFITPNERLWPFPTVLVINQAAYDGLTRRPAEDPGGRGGEAARALAGDLQRSRAPSRRRSATTA